MSVGIRGLTEIFQNLYFIAATQSYAAVAVRTDTIFRVQLEIPEFRIRYEIDSGRDVAGNPVPDCPFDFPIGAQRMPTAQVTAVEEISRTKRSTRIRLRQSTPVPVQLESRRMLPATPSYSQGFHCLADAPTDRTALGNYLVFTIICLARTPPTSGLSGPARPCCNA